MAWFDEAVFYHIYPLGLLDCPKENPYLSDGAEVTHKLPQLIDWLDHCQELGVNALVLGPVFKSLTHGYDTVDYREVDKRLGSNEDLKNLVQEAHSRGIKVLLDGVFNHVSREFFAFKDVREKREGSQYTSWFNDLNFWGNNSFNDGFSYGTWGGYDILAKLNLQNPDVQNYHFETIKYWVDEFNIDGLRLDAAQDIDLGFLHNLRSFINTVKEDFWMEGEVVHGEINRWVGPEMMHSATDYPLQKAYFSGLNDHNFFEIAHTVERTVRLFGGDVHQASLYGFVENHDVNRLASMLNNPEHLKLAYQLMFTLPTKPSIYYGGEFGLKGKHENNSDDALRPALSLSHLPETNDELLECIKTLGTSRSTQPALSYGDYKVLLLTTTNFAYARTYEGNVVISALNNSDDAAVFDVEACGAPSLKGLFSGEEHEVVDGKLHIELPSNSSEVYSYLPSLL